MAHPLQPPPQAVQMPPALPLPLPPPPPGQKPTNVQDKQHLGRKKPRLIFTPNQVSSLLTILSFILSLPLLVSIIYLFYMRNYDCESLLRLPKLQIGIGVGLLAAFIISNLALLLRTKYPMVVVIVTFVPLMVMCVVGLGLVGSYEHGARRIMASPTWFRVKVHDAYNWNYIKACIFDKGTCDEFYLRLNDQGFSDKVSSIEGGCCMPPTVCGMVNVNGSFVKSEEVDGDNRNKVSHRTRDCGKWDNNRTVLCYNCLSCKNGFIAPLEDKWYKLGIFLVVMGIFLSVSHLLLFLSTMWEKFRA